MEIRVRLLGSISGSGVSGGSVFGGGSRSILLFLTERAGMRRPTGTFSKL